MKLTIAFLQLLPVGSLKGYMEKGIKACFQAKGKGADIVIQKFIFVILGKKMMKVFWMQEMIFLWQNWIRRTEL